MGNEDLPNIYSMTASVSMKKGNRTMDREVWIVSRYDTPHEIMSKDDKTMGRLKSELYGKAYRGDRYVIVREIRTKKVVGKVNRTAL